MKNSKVLIVDDNIRIITSLKQLLKGTIREIDGIQNPNLIFDSLKNKRYDLILLDMNFKGTVNSGNEGIFWLNEIKKKIPTQNIIMMTAFGDIDLAVKSIIKGAGDFITKPWDPETLIEKVKNHLGPQVGISESASDLNEGDEIIGQSVAMVNLKKMIKQVAPTDANILIAGENGTGKNMIAKSIHHLSQRKAKPLISVDLGAINENLIESELFGHVKGSFSGAISDKKGYLECADGGTLFLDEIANLSMQSQQKILRILQERKVSKIGSEKEISIDFRLICATNANLKQHIEKGLFREDLFYRISTIEIQSPPLRDREADIYLLTNYFFKKYNSKYQRNIKKIDESSLQKLGSNSWPGNVRQLDHFIEKCVILCGERILTLEDFPDHQVPSTEYENITRLEDMEKTLILKVIQKNKGNLSKASEDLGISRSTLYLKVSKYGL